VERIWVKKFFCSFLYFRRKIPKLDILRSDVKKIFLIFFNIILGYFLF